MDRLPEHVFVKFNADTLISLRKLYNLDGPGQMDEAVDLLEEWVKKQNHFVRKQFPRDYLERVIIQQKGSVERAKGQLDKICTLRTLLPRYFDKCDMIKDYEFVKDFLYLTLLPKLTSDQNRIVFIKYNDKQYTPKVLFYIYCQIVLMCEYLKRYDYFNALTVVVDFRQVTNLLNFITQLNLTEMKEICTIFLEGFDTRIKNFLFMSESKTIDMLIKIFKSMISEKLAQRIHILKDNEELYQHVERRIMPSDYGGEDKPIAELTEEFRKELGSEDNKKYFIEMSKVQTIESMRIPSKYNGDFSELAGTFRSLSFD